MRFSLEVPEDELQRVLDAFVRTRPIPLIPNPDNPDETIPEYSPTEWFIKQIKTYVVNVLENYERENAAITARDAVERDEDVIVGG